ncbi:MAG TPA: copper resistance CopC family protein [Chloroflexota bacterium]|jgi:hypothetical protein
MRRVLLGLLVLGIGLGGSWRPTPAEAHAHFQESTPAPDAVLSTPPPRLTILFDEELDGDNSKVQVLGPTGQRADRDDVQADGTRMWISLLDRGPGVYRVRWKAIADDDKGETRGDFTFTVAQQLPANVPQLSLAPAVADNGQTVTLGGSGFKAGGDVVLSVGDGEDFLALAHADDHGRFSLQAALPADLPFGRQVVQAADAADHLAAVALHVPRGGWPAAVVRMSGDPQPDEIDYTIRVENRSGYALRDIVVRADVPSGTRVLAEGLGQPDAAEHATLDGGQVVWKAKSLPAHSVLGPFTFNVLTAGLSGRPTLGTSAMLEYAHTWEPRFRGTAQTEDVRVQVSNR